MKKRSIEKNLRYRASQLPIDRATDWARVDAMKSRELKYNAVSDKEVLLADKKFWEAAKRVMPTSLAKERITIRLDTDVLDWLKEDGRGYQTRINTILRSCMNVLKMHDHPK